MLIGSALARDGAGGAFHFASYGGHTSNSIPYNGNRAKYKPAPLPTIPKPYQTITQGTFFKIHWWEIYNSVFKTEILTPAPTIPIFVGCLFKLGFKPNSGLIILWFCLYLNWQQIVILKWRSQLKNICKLSSVFSLPQRRLSGVDTLQALTVPSIIFSLLKESPEFRT